MPLLLDQPPSPAAGWPTRDSSAKGQAQSGPSSLPRELVRESSHSRLFALEALSRAAGAPRAPGRAPPPGARGAPGVLPATRGRPPAKERARARSQGGARDETPRGRRLGQTRHSFQGLGFEPGARGAADGSRCLIWYACQTSKRPKVYIRRFQDVEARLTAPVGAHSRSRGPLLPWHVRSEPFLTSAQMKRSPLFISRPPRTYRDDTRCDLNFARAATCAQRKSWRPRLEPRRLPPHSRLRAAARRPPSAYRRAPWRRAIRWPRRRGGPRGHSAAMEPARWLACLSSPRNLPWARPSVRRPSAGPWRHRSKPRRAPPRRWACR